MRGIETAIGCAKGLLCAGLFSASLAALAVPDAAQVPALISSEAPVVADLGQAEPVPQCYLAEQQQLVSAARYLQGRANQLEGNNAYSDYMTRIAQRRPQLYISDNAGSLRAVDPATGGETFSFTPQAVVAEPLGAEPVSDQYYLGSRSVVADIYAHGQWRTLLVGILGAAGKGLFALDITNPNAIKLLWELDARSEVFKELGVQLGYSFPQPSIARLHNGRWAVVTGNGYSAQGSEYGAAALYIIDAVDGSLIKRLEVQSDLAQPNGLSSPRLADYDGDGIADYAYAGDLHGNLWRFDLFGDGAAAEASTPPRYGASSGSSAGFKPSYAGQPLFSAAAQALPQSIIAAPSVVPHPTGIGYLVLFGTGHYVANENQAKDASQHSLYGIWDSKTAAQTTAAESISPKQLALQSISNTRLSIAQNAEPAREVRVMSNHPVEWYTDFDATQPVKQRGWRLDLPAGEMLIETMQSLGSMLLLQTLLPSSERCVTDDSHWLYAINPATGGATGHHVFAQQTAEDGIVSAIQFGALGGIDIGQSGQGFAAYAQDQQARIAPPPESVGRQSWRVIVEP